jgi:hypothetical protein
MHNTGLVSNTCSLGPEVGGIIDITVAKSDQHSTALFEHLLDSDKADHVSNQKNYKEQYTR